MFTLFLFMCMYAFVWMIACVWVHLEAKDGIGFSGAGDADYETPNMISQP